VGKSKKNAAIPLQQWLRESATVFRYTQIAFLLHDDQVKDAVLKWLYEPTENVIRHLLGGIKQLVKESDTSLENKWDNAENIILILLEIPFH
jgi:hypothetical protein